MAGSKRCALKRRKREREKKRKEKEKGGKMGIKIVFSYVQWSFFGYIKLTVSRLIISAIICDQSINGESIWRLVRAKYAPPPFWQLFQIPLVVLRI